LSRGQQPPSLFIIVRVGRQLLPAGPSDASNICDLYMPSQSLLTKLIEKFKSANRRLIIALACYFVLIVTALVALLPVRNSNDRFVLGLVLALFAILIIKTIAHSLDDSK
jgi:hypothetical protein